MKNIAEHIASVERSGCNVIVKTSSWYSKIVSNEIMESKLAPLVMSTFPQKHTIFLIAHDQKGAQEIVDKISAVREEYIDKRRSELGLSIKKQVNPDG